MGDKKISNIPLKWPPSSVNYIFTFEYGFSTLVNENKWLGRWNDFTYFCMGSCQSSSVGLYRIKFAKVSQHIPYH